MKQKKTQILNVWILLSYFNVILLFFKYSGYQPQKEIIPLGNCWMLSLVGQSALQTSTLLAANFRIWFTYCFNVYFISTPGVCITAFVIRGQAFCQIKYLKYIFKHFAIFIHIWWPSYTKEVPPLATTHCGK